jgi:hypothetical protein
MRAERSGNGGDRRYRVIYYGADAWNEVYDTLYITVPHDSGIEERPGIELNDRAGVPAETALRAPRPNPFNPETTVSFDLVREERVRLVIANVAGARVRVLVDEDRPAGTHQVRWDGRDESGREVASGIYFVRMQAGAYSSTRKLTLLK